MSEKVAVLGPKGTFTEKAAKVMYPDRDVTYFDFVEDVFEYVEQDMGPGVAALENSLEGPVGTTLESLLEYDVKIVGRTTLLIELYLMAKKGVKKKDVKTVMSHPHALGQCRAFLKKSYPKAKKEPVSSTVEAIKKAKRSKTKAAIGPLDAGKAAGLRVLGERVQDRTSETRFIAISKNKAAGPKTSLIFSVPDKPGSLYEVIKLFADKSINMTKIESRPSKNKLGEYLFYVDYENKNMRQQELERFHGHLRKKTKYFKYLGSY